MTRRRLTGRRRAIGLGWKWAAGALVTAAFVVAVVVAIVEFVPRISRPAPVTPGERAPTFVLDSSAGERVALGDYLGRTAVVLIFHGGYHCTACRAQLGKLRHELARIKALGAEVLAISDDRALEARRIAAEVGHEIAILSDQTRAVGFRYGMRDRERRLALTGYVVIDRAGTVRARRVDPLFGEHADEIMGLLSEAATSAGP